MRKKFAKHRTQEEILEIIKLSTSKRQTLLNLGLNETGGNYSTLNRYIEVNKIDTSHFRGQQTWNKGKIIGPSQPIEYYLVKDCPTIISSHKLKQRLLKENIFEYVCSKCKNTEWLGQPISLELEHIDGDHYNNCLENLCLLCPNCHAQTSTYCRSLGSRNLSLEDKQQRKRERNREYRLQRRLAKGLSPTKKRNPKQPRIAKPRPLKFVVQKEELEVLINSIPFIHIGKMFDVSDNAIRKRCMKLGIPLISKKLRQKS